MRLVTGAVGTALVLAALQPAQAPGLADARDAVFGAGENIFNTQFKLRTGSGADGESPRGRIVFRVPGGPDPLNNEAKVTCMTVMGNRATIGGRLARPIQTPSGPAGAVLVGVTDGDGAATPVPDGVTFYPVALPPTTCPPPSSPDDALVEGDVTVRDAEARLAP